VEKDVMQMEMQGAPEGLYLVSFGSHGDENVSSTFAFQINTVLSKQHVGREFLECFLAEMGCVDLFSPFL